MNSGLDVHARAREPAGYYPFLTTPAEGDVDIDLRAAI
jgi:hypothetical protein